MDVCVYICMTTSAVMGGRQGRKEGIICVVVVVVAFLILYRRLSSRDGGYHVISCHVMPHL